MREWLRIDHFYYDPKTGMLSRKDGRSVRVHLMGGGSRTKGHGEYWAVYADGKMNYVHRLAFYFMTGKMPRGHVDHINGDKTDNRWCNLREANMSQNKANEGLRSTNTSGWKGVSWHKKARKWRAYYGPTGTHLGLFDTPEEAHAVYCHAASESFGEFARFE